MIPALSQVCTLHAAFEQDVENYSSGHCRAMEVWLTKLETYLESHSLDDVRRLLEQHEMAVPVASFQGGLLTSQGDARREHWNHFAKRLELCRALGIKTLVVAGDIMGPADQLDLSRMWESLHEAGKLGAEYQVRVALEFQSRATYINNLESAAQLVESAGTTHLGLCLDAFHFITGPSKEMDLEYLNSYNLFHVQLCDILGSREFATDSDRILPGDGDFPLAKIVNRLREIGYDGCVSIELMNPAIWKIPPRQFSEIAITALRKLLGMASMGSS